MIPFKSKISHITDVAERNKAFEALVDSEKRQEVALDIINNYSLGFIKEQHGSQYWPPNFANDGRRLETSEELQSFVIANGKGILCNVCARGAIMVSRIILGNNISPDASFYDGDSRVVEGQFVNPASEFSDGLLMDVERYYENYGFIRYRRKTPECIAALAANILANGDFIHKDETDYLIEWEIQIKDISNIEPASIPEDDF